MDFHFMKRKQLQALCKKHGVSANLTSREMADRLSLIFKKNKKGESTVKKSGNKASEGGSKVVKKVRFSPENETFIYEGSGYKRDGRRSSLRPLTKKQILPSTSRKRARKDDVEAKTDVERRNVRGRCLKKARSGGSKDNDGGKITRSRASESGAVQEEFGRKGKGRIGSKILAGDGAERDKVSRVRRGNGEFVSEMLTENSREAEVSGRKTRSRAKIASEAETVSFEEPNKKRRVGRRTLAVEATGTKDGESEMSIVEHQEPSKDVGRYASRRKKSVPKVEIEGFQEKKETSKRTRTTNSNVEVGANATKNGESEMSTVEPEELSKDVNRHASRNKSIGKVEVQEKKETRKSSRNTNSKVEVEAVGKTCKGIDKVENVSVLSGPSRRTRRSTVMFASSAEDTRKRTRNSKTKLETASIVEAIEESSKESDEVVNVSLPSGPSRRTRRNTIMFPPSVSTDGEVETHQPVRVEEDGCSSKGYLRRSSRNASRTNSTLDNSKMERTASGVGTKGKQQKQRQEQIVDDDISTSKCKPLVENLPRRSSRVASKSDLVKLAGPTNKVAGKKRHNRSKMEGTASGVGTKGKQQKQRREQIVDDDISMSKCKPLVENLPRRSSRVASKSDLVKPAGPTNKVAGKKRHNRSRMPVIEESSSERFSASKEPLIEDVGLAVGEAERATNNVDASYSKQVLESSNRKKKTFRGQFEATVNLDVHEVTNITANLKETSPTNQADNLTEPSSILAWEKAIEAEEPSTGKNINHRSDNADDRVNKDDRILVQEHQTLVHAEDDGETADTVIQEAIFEENPNERSSEKRFQVFVEKAAEISLTNPSDEQGRSHTQAVEVQEIAAESNLGIGESSALRTTEMQLRTNGGNATRATPSRPALETEGFDNEVNNDPGHLLTATNVDLKEGAYTTGAQNVFQSTELERGDTHSIGEESSGIGMDSDKFICIGESSVSTAWDGEDVTTNNIQPEETLNNERTSQVLGEKITEDDYNVNLPVGDFAIMGSVKRNDGDTKKENEVLEQYAEDAVETENEVSEKTPNNFSGEDRGRWMHEPLLAEDIDLIITEERGTDVVKDTSVACVDLQPATFTGNKGIRPELALLENELISDEHETVSDIGTEKLSSFRARLSVHNDMQDKLKAKLNEDAMDILKAEVQTEPLSQFALDKLQNSMENDTQVASNSSCKALCQPIGDCSSGSRTEVQDSDLVEERSSCVATREIDKEADVKLCADVALEKNLEGALKVELDANVHDLETKDIDGKGFAGESDVEECADDVMEEHHKDADVKLCADVAQEKNLEGALKVELDANVHDLETKDIDGKGFAGESDVEECADVVMEENVDCLLEIEFGDKNDLERMAPLVNDSNGASLREIIVKESECTDKIDMLKMEESTSKNRDSNAVVMDVGAPSPVIANHSIEMEGANVDDSSIQNGEIATDRETGTEAVKKLMGEVDNGGTSAGVSPIIPGKAFKDKFTEINAAASGALSEIISAPCKDLEEKSEEVLGPGQHVDEVKFDNVKDSEEENVIELERNCFVTSDSNDTDTGRKANNEIAGDSNFDFNGCDDVKENDTDVIPQVPTNDLDDHLQEVEFHNASESDHNFMLDEAGEAFDFENVEDGTKSVQKTPFFSQTIKNDRKGSMKSSAKGKCYADSSSDKPKMGSNTAAVSHLMVMPSLEVTENKSLELHDDLPQLTSSEVNKILMVGKQVEVEKSAGGNSEANLITQDQEAALEVKENLTNDEQVNQQVTEEQLGEQEHQLHLTISDEPLKITQVLVDVPEVKESVTTNEQVNQQVTEKQVGEQGSHQSHLFVSDEFLEMTQDRGDSLEVSENVTTDEHITKKPLVERENQSHLAVSDEPICDDEETNEQNGQSAIDQGCNDNDFHKDSSCVSMEKVIPRDATQTSGSNIDDSDMFNLEHGSYDSREADTIVVDSAVYSVSRLKGDAADEVVNIEGAKKMDILEGQNGGTWLPMMPTEQCTDQENPEEASPGITGTVLQKIFSSSSGSEEINVSENRLFSDAFSEYEVPASSSVSYLYDLSFCNEIQIKDYYNSAGGKMVDDDRGKNHGAVALLFQGDKDSAVGNSEATENSSAKNNIRDTQEVLKEQFDEDEGNRKDATCLDILNQSSPDNKSRGCVMEADGLGHFGDAVFTAGNSKEVADFDGLTGASSLAPEKVVDCSNVSPVLDFSDSELKVEPDIFTVHEINLFTGPGELEEIENSDAGASASSSIRHESGEVSKNVVTVEAQQVTEQVQLSENKTTEEVAKFKCDFVGGSNNQELVLDMNHGTPDHKNSKNESLKLDRIDSAPSRDAAAGDLWRWELDLLSPRKKSPDLKSVKNFSYAKKTNSSMKTNCSVRKPSSRSSLIQSTPKQFVHDMKENVVGTKRDFSSTTAHKPASQRRALEDIRKN